MDNPSLFEINLFEIFPVQSTLDNTKPIEPFESVLKEMKTHTYEGIKEGANYFGVKPKYPNIGWASWTIYTKPPVAGYQLEECDASGCTNEIGYNPLLITTSYEKRKKVGMHEGWHAVQPGKTILSLIYYDINDKQVKYGRFNPKDEDKYPLGIAIIEGGTEAVLEDKVKGEASYPKSYNLVKEMENRGIYIKDLHKLAGIVEQKLGNKLKDFSFNPSNLRVEEAPPELLELLYKLNMTKEIIHKYATNQESDLIMYA